MANLLLSDVPNNETTDALKEGCRLLHDSEAKTYTDLGQLWKDLESNI